MSASSLHRESTDSLILTVHEMMILVLVVPMIAVTITSVGALGTVHVYRRDMTVHWNMYFCIML